MVRINGVISAIYKWGMNCWQNSLMLTFYQNFQRDIQVGGGTWMSMEVIVTSE